MLERFGPDGAADVVDEDIEAAEAFERLIDHTLAVGKALQVRGQGEDFSVLAEGVPQFVDDLGAVHRDDLRALFHQSFGDATADALGGAGDEGDLVVESFHGDLMALERAAL